MNFHHRLHLIVLLAITGVIGASDFDTHSQSSRLNVPHAPRQIQCVDENNHPVDWIIFYKLPRVHGSPNAHIVNGEAYMYVSSEDVKHFEAKKKAARGETKWPGTNANRESELGKNEENSKALKTEAIRERNIQEHNDKQMFSNNHVESKVINDANLSSPFNEIDAKNNLVNKGNIANIYDADWYHQKRKTIETNAKSVKHKSHVFDGDQTNKLKSVMNVLKDVLVKQSVKDARDQIKGEENVHDNEIEDQAELLKSELAGGSGRRKFRRDVQRSVPYYWNEFADNFVDAVDIIPLDSSTEHDDSVVNRLKESIVKDSKSIDKNIEKASFSDGMQLLKDLLKKYKSKDERSPEFFDFPMENGKDVDVGNDLLELVRAMQLLFDHDYNEGTDYNEETIAGLTRKLDDSIRAVDSETDDGLVTKSWNLENGGKHDVINPSKTSRAKNPTVKDMLLADSKPHIVETIHSDSISNAEGDDLQWKLSSYSVRDPASLPGKILSPLLFDGSYGPEFAQDGFKILYNDQTPNSTTVKFGHSKGLVVGNSEGGIWIIHSVPHFVDDSQKEYSYPHTGLMYGQNFLCLSLSQSELDTIGNNLGHNQVYKYSTYLSANNRPLYPTLAKVIDGTYTPSKTNFFRGVVHTRFKSVRFETFAKTRELGADLYKYIGQDLNQSLLVETWPNGPGRLPSDCKRSQLVENVAGINVSGVVAFRSTHDHAKWTISFQRDPKSGDNARNAPNGKSGTEATDLSGIERVQVDWLKRSESVGGVNNGGFALNSVLTRADGEPDPTLSRFFPTDDLLDYLNAFDLESSDADEGVNNLDVQLENMDDFASLLFLPNTERQKRSETFVNFQDNNLDENMNNLDTLDEKANGDTQADGSLTDGLLDGGFELAKPEDILDAILNKNGEKESKVMKDTEKKFKANKARNSLSDSSGSLAEARRYAGSATPSDTSAPGDFSYYVCNGDINRAEDQLKRGGGSVCLLSEDVWRLYDSLVSSVEPCPSN